MKEYKKVNFEEININALAQLGFEVVPGVIGYAGGTVLMVREKPEGQISSEYFKDRRAIDAATRLRQRSAEPIDPGWVENLGKASGPRE